MKSAATRRDDSVQFSLDALRRLELERIDQEQLTAARHAAEQRRQEEEAQRLEAQRARADEQRAEQAEREWQLRLDDQKRQVEDRERRQVELARLEVEQKRIELAARQAEVEVQRAQSLSKPRGRWLSTLLVVLALCAQAFTVYQLDKTRNRNAVVTAELIAADDRNESLQSRLDAALARVELATKAVTPTTETKVETPKVKPTKVKPTKVKPPKVKPPKVPTDERIHLNCDLTSPLGCARR
jgi:hypothetical protein